jgi:signal transduction histidine kinase
VQNEGYWVQAWANRPFGVATVQSGRMSAIDRRLSTEGLVENERISERQQTDESLRVEREKADQALGEELTAIDQTADAVISRARSRADEVLAAARAKTDTGLARHVAPKPPPQILMRERAQEDQVIHEERATADEALCQERADHVALLSRERDDTDTDLATERARSDDALATRDEFLSVVSHDLRNMLNAIGGSAELIAEVVSRDHHEEQVRMGARRIQRSAARMTRLVGDLVDVASIHAGKLAVAAEVGDPTPLVLEAVETFLPQAAAGGVALLTEIVQPSSTVAFDPARLLQVLTNLLSNALKFTPAGGTVVVHVEDAGADMRFTVSDTGPGVPNDQLEAVFNRFVQVTQNDRRGVGLGLYISRAIVEGHGGRIWAENRVGGSAFYFTLPMQTSS